MTDAPQPRPETLAAWHRVADSRDPAALDVLLADDCVFRSPAVHTPQEGKALTTAYLAAALVVLGPTLRYVDEWWSDTSAVLEFEAEVGGLTVHGVDMLRWGADGRLTSFTVMVRPFKGLTALMEAMAAELMPRNG
jgi:SnoaL-like protein